jgi:hypothetical protein
MQITVLDEEAAGAVETAELVAGARNGDRVAWDGLVDRFGGTVWAVAARTVSAPRTPPTSARSPGCC